METFPREFNVLANQYKLQKLLGKGAFGTVILAVDRKSQKQVAIKAIKLIKSSYKSLQLYREIKILKLLSEFEPTR